MARVVLAPVGPVACCGNVLSDDRIECEIKHSRRAERKVWRTYTIRIWFEISLYVDEPVVCQNICDIAHQADRDADRYRNCRSGAAVVPSGMISDNVPVQPDLDMVVR